MAIIVAAIVAIVLIFLINAIRIVREYERGVIFRLGRLVGAKGPGIFLLIPVVDKMVKVTLRMITLDVPPQEVITKDNVTTSVNAVLFFRVVDANAAVVQVENYIEATRQIAMTTLRSVLGGVELDQLLSEREEINLKLQEIIDAQTDPWGIKVKTVEVKDVKIPGEMQRAIARQAEAERERRAKIINAEGELQASTKLSEAAAIISRNPAALQLRYLQSLVDISAENASTIVFPIPIDMFKLFRNSGSQDTNQ
jgi:regulator of protease activity HflC (stomatin/prohibitin superfamily)